MENTKKMDGNNMGVEVENTINDAAQEATSAANKTFQNVQKYCRENPGIAMGIAAGVGALVSLALMKAFSEKESENEKMISDLFRKGEKIWSQIKSRVEPVVNDIRETAGI